MRISLFHITLVFLTILHSVTARSGFSDGWSSFVGFAEDTQMKVSKGASEKAQEFAKVAGVKALEFSKEAGEKAREFAKVASVKVVEFSNEASQTAVGFANVVGGDLAVANKTLEEFKASIAEVVFKVQAMERDIHNDLEAHGISSDRIFDMLSAQLPSMFEGLKAEFSELPPEKPTAECACKDPVVARFLDMVEDWFVTISSLWHMPEGDARRSFGIIKPELCRAIIITVNLITNHPSLFIYAFLFLIPQSWILRLLLRIFGFGPLGPVKGSAAAWLQRQIWGGAVKAGSWFAVLQYLAMKFFR